MSRFGAKGNFEMVVPLASGGVQHFWRTNDEVLPPTGGDYHWHPGQVFATDLGQVDGVTLIQSNFSLVGNGRGNLEAIVRKGDQLYHFWLGDKEGSAWAP